MTAPAAGGACDVSRIDTEKIEQLLRSGKIDRCRETVGAFLREIRFQELTSLMLRLYVIMDIYIAARSFTKEISRQPPSPLSQKRTGEETVLKSDNTVKVKVYAVITAESGRVFRLPVRVARVKKM